jgi:hypothetical protein
MGEAAVALVNDAFSFETYRARLLSVLNAVIHGPAVAPA